jgi:hypothetical protein
MLGDPHAFDAQFRAQLASLYKKDFATGERVFSSKVRTKLKVQFSIGQEVKAQLSRIVPATIGHNTAAITTSSNNQDLFWVIGDSFAQGSNNSTGFGPDATGKEDYFRTSDNTFQPVTTTDIPGAVNGSPWPQFGIDYFNATGGSNHSKWNRRYKIL